MARDGAHEARHTFVGCKAGIERKQPLRCKRSRAPKIPRVRAGRQSRATRAVFAYELRSHLGFFERSNEGHVERLLRRRLDVVEVRVPAELRSHAIFAQPHAQFGIFPTIEVKLSIEAM